MKATSPIKQQGSYKKEPEVILYKYYGFNAGISALYSQKLGFREPRYFNDPFELSYLDNSDNANYIASKVDELKKSFVILSLTKTPYNPLMWAHYGDEHRGFVIGYDVSGEFLQSSDYNILSVNEGDVVYTRSKEHFPLTKELKDTLQNSFLISRGVSFSEFEELERKNIVSLLKKALLYKHSCWSYEEEVRVVKILHSMLFTSEEWQSDPNRSYTTLSRRVAPRIATSIDNGLYIFNKKVPIKEVYLGKRNPLRQEAKENSVMDDSLVELAKKLSWSVKLVNISTGTWGLDSEDSSADKLRIPGKTEGLLNSFSFDGNEAEYLSDQLPKIGIDKGDQFELTNWFGEISIQKNGEFIEYKYQSLPERQVFTAYFNGHPIKYFIMPDKGLLINTSDYCRAMGIVDRPSGHILGEPCLDIVSASMFAGSNTDFIRWLIDTFAGFDPETIVHPICDDEWSNLNNYG